jgi:nitronate monooxygenase
VRSRRERFRSARITTRDKGGPFALSLWAGQSVGLVSKVQAAGDIVREIVDEAQSILRRVAR